MAPPQGGADNSPRLQVVKPNPYQLPMGMDGRVLLAITIVVVLPGERQQLCGVADPAL